MHRKLREMRNEKKYTSKQMADMLGISRAYYTQIEKCMRRLSYPMAIEIAKIFGAKPDDIFYEEYKDKK